MHARYVIVLDGILERGLSNCGYMAVAWRIREFGYPTTRLHVSRRPYPGTLTGAISTGHYPPGTPVLA